MYWRDTKKELPKKKWIICIVLSLDDDPVLATYHPFLSEWKTLKGQNVEYVDFWTELPTEHYIYADD